MTSVSEVQQNGRGLPGMMEPCVANGDVVEGAVDKTRERAEKVHRKRFCAVYLKRDNLDVVLCQYLGE